MSITFSGVRASFVQFGARYPKPIVQAIVNKDTETALREIRDGNYKLNKEVSGHSVSDRVGGRPLDSALRYDNETVALALLNQYAQIRKHDLQETKSPSLKNLLKKLSDDQTPVTREDLLQAAEDGNFGIYDRLVEKRKRTATANPFTLSPKALAKLSDSDVIAYDPAGTSKKSPARQPRVNKKLLG